MAKISEEVINKLKQFIDYIENKGIHIDSAILFGSYAKGSNTKWSDIDVALVSEMFEGNRYKDLDKLTEACLKIDSDISPLPYRPEDFVDDDLFVKEIKRTGIRIV
jgi:predicted nucleotidyltransferase